jgi:hypothetical protein
LPVFSTRVLTVRIPFAVSVTNLAKSFLALALLVNASAVLAQTLPSSDEKKRLERFETEVDASRERLKIPGLSVVLL